MKHLLIALALSPAPAPTPAQVNLPVLGDGTSAVSSLADERRLGQAFLRQLRGQLPPIQPRHYLVQHYLERLTARLIAHSELRESEFDLLLIINPHINAFAAPGNIMGVHSGLLVRARREAELASVMGHEIAHLSLRHYARGKQAQCDKRTLTMAGVLAGILATAVSGGSGLALLGAVSGVAVESQLAHSRQFEREADRAGLDNLYKAGIDPSAVGDMFGTMMQAARFNRTQTTWVTTHPLTEERRADAQNHARRYPPKRWVPEGPDFALAKVLADDSRRPQEALRHHKAMVAKDPGDMAALYGLGLAQLDTRDAAAALRTAARLLDMVPGHAAFVILQARAKALAGHGDALQGLAAAAAAHPRHYALQMHHADLLQAAGQLQQATGVLRKLRKWRPGDPAVHNALARIHKRTGNLYAMHQARAEYLVHTGDLVAAIKQLRQAGRSLPPDDRVERQRTLGRISQIDDMLQNNPFTQLQGC